MDGAPWRRGESGWSTLEKRGEWMEHLGEEGRVDGAPWREGSEWSTLEGSTLEGSTLEGSTLEGSTFEGSTLEGSEWSTLERLYLGRE